VISSQGSIIDRIDYNMEKAAEHTAKGTSELVKAEGYQRRSPAMCCIVVLSLLLALATLLLILKILGHVSV